MSPLLHYFVSGFWVEVTFPPDTEVRQPPGPGQAGRCVPVATGTGSGRGVGTRYAEDTAERQAHTPSELGSHLSADWSEAVSSPITISGACE